LEGFIPAAPRTVQISALARATISPLLDLHQAAISPSIQKAMLITESSRLLPYFEYRSKYLNQQLLRAKNNSDNHEKH
jgi:hypothetical protein